MKRHKVMDLDNCGVHIEVIRTDEATNPYRVYHIKWGYSGGRWASHRNQIGRFKNLEDCLSMIWRYYRENRGTE